MAFDGTDFEDLDNTAARPAGSGSGSAGRAPTREELDARLTGTQQQLAKLRETQEQLERARISLEEMRRRRTEFSAGLTEMRQQLARGCGLLEKAEFDARRNAEQLARTLDGLRSAAAALEPLGEKSWTDENWEQELTRALTVIENARMEHNAARLKWPLLDGKPAASADAARSPDGPPLASLSLGKLCRLGLAFTWPLALVLLVVGTIGLLLLARR